MILGGLLGKTIQEGEQWLNEVKPKNGDTVVTTIRAMEIDGEAMMGTEDYREDRANVSIVAGRITQVQGCS